MPTIWKKIRRVSLSAQVEWLPSPVLLASIYQLQRATSVTGTWMSNATITAVPPGLIEVHDTNAPSGRPLPRRTAID